MNKTLNAQTITLSSSNPAIPSAYIAQSSTKQPIYQAIIQTMGDDVRLEEITFTVTGSYAVSDINRLNNNYGLQVWKNTTNNLATAVSISNRLDISPSGTVTTLDINNTDVSNGTYYIWITADIHPNAVPGHTLTVGALTPANFTFSRGTKSGTMNAGGTQTIIEYGSNIYVDRSSLTGFSYIEGNGPSAFQYYVVNGTGLVSNVTITAPTHYEISTSSGSGYTNSLSLTPTNGFLSSTTIYVRLKSGLNINIYNSENIVHTSTNAPAKNVVCSGEVTCDLSPPTVTSPIYYCLNTPASPLTANGSNLLWVRSGSSSVGGTTNPTNQAHSAFNNSFKYTYFTVTSNVSSVSIQSVDWFIPSNQSVDNLQIAIQNSDGSAVTNGTQTNGPFTLNDVGYGRRMTSTFSDLVLTSGNYRIAIVSGDGRFGVFNSPSYPQTEATGSINITGNSGGQLYYNLQFTYLHQTTTAPTPNTSVVGSYYYYVTQTVDGCTSGPATIEVIVTPGGANMTVSAASSSPTLCTNTTLTNITHTTTGATGISNDGVSGANGLPPGVSAHWASNTITISGIPSASGTFNYSIPLTGGCGSVNATGTITLNPINTADTPSSNPTLCINTALSPNITIATTGATGIGTPTGLPSGVSAAWASNTITISGTPSASGTFIYSIPLTGGCGSVNATGTITVVAQPTSPPITRNPDINNVCAGQTLTVTTSAGSGGTGTIADEYRYSTDNGNNWSAWSTSVPNFAAVVGTNIIQSRRIADGTGCNTSASNQVSWNVVPQPTAPTINTKTPNLASVCQSNGVSATFNAGSGGVGCSDDYILIIDGGVPVAYTPSSTVGTTATSSIVIQGRRANCTSGAGCTSTAYSTLVSWNINSPTVTISTDYVEDCPELDPAQGFNPQSGNYDAGSTKLVFEVSLSGTTSAIWSFNYAIGGTGVSVRTSGVPSPNYPQSDSVSNTTSNPVVLTFYINNNPPVELYPSLTISNITDANGCSATNVSSSVTIKAMPDVGDYE